MDTEGPRILQNHPQVLSTLHVVLAPVVVVADVRDLLVNSAPVVSLPLVIVVLVAVVFVWVLVVLVLFGDLEDYLILLLLIQVVWVDELELRVVANVIELLHLLVFVDNVKRNGFFLDQELRVLMLKEWGKVLVLPLRGFFWVKDGFSVYHLKLVVAVIGCEVRVRHQLWIQVELMRGKWIDGHEGDSVGLKVFDMTHVLDGLLKNFVLA